MSKLMVIGNCYCDRNTEYSKELFKSIEDAGYVLGYNSNTSVIIMKEIPDEDSEE